MSIFEQNCTTPVPTLRYLWNKRYVFILKGPYIGDHFNFTKSVAPALWIWMILEDGMLHYCAGIKRRPGDTILITKEVTGASGHHHLSFTWPKLTFVSILHSLSWKHHRLPLQGCSIAQVKGDQMVHKCFCYIRIFSAC